MIEKDFMVEMPKLREYIRRLQRWRDLYEKNLDDRSKTLPLDQGGCNLTEFHHTKFDDVEIPGQYVQVSWSSNVRVILPILTVMRKAR